MVSNCPRLRLRFLLLFKYTRSISALAKNGPHSAPCHFVLGRIESSQRFFAIGQPYDTFNNQSHCRRKEKGDRAEAS